MSKSSVKRALVAGVLALAVSAAMAVPVEGTTSFESGPSYHSSWLDLKSPTTFKKGETLAIKVDGAAEKVLVRLVSASEDPGALVGVEGKVRTVPADRVLIVVLERDRANVKQISVHAGASAWGTSLGANNGAAFIVKVDRVTK